MKTKATLERVVGLASAEAGPELVAQFDFSFLLGFALDLVVQWLGSCMEQNAEQAKESVQSSVFYPYWAKRAAKQAVREKYGKHARRDDATKIVTSAMMQVTPEERAEVANEFKGEMEAAGMLI